MSVKVNKHSRLRFSELLSSEGVEFWDTLVLPTIVSQTDDMVYEVTSSDRIDTIANKFYGDPVLWWVVAAANDMELVPTALYEGQKLRIPAPRYVLQELFQQVGSR